MSVIGKAPHSSQYIRNPLIVALDVDEKDQALRLAEDLKDTAGGFKVGPRLMNKYGAEIVNQLSRYAPVFVDCKFFDIPSTMESAVRSCFEAGASLVTVHALAGEQALKKLAQVQKEFQKKRPCLILAVTILTSWDQESAPSVIKNLPISEHVKSLAELAKKSGLGGVVCSAEELETLRMYKLFLVTPGIRLEENSKDDQKRTMGPAEAISLGASALVVGRPIIGAQNPRAAAEEFLRAILKNQ